LLYVLRQEEVTYIDALKIPSLVRDRGAPSVVWEKFKALRKRADLATKRLWGIAMGK